ncbi:protein of unknown function [Streptomyces murinus]
MTPLRTPWPGRVTAPTEPAITRGRVRYPCAPRKTGVFRRPGRAGEMLTAIHHQAASPRSGCDVLVGVRQARTGRNLRGRDDREQECEASRDGRTGADVRMTGRTAGLRRRRRTDRPVPGSTGLFHRELVIR